MSHMESRYSNITVVQRVTPVLRVEKSELILSSRSHKKLKQILRLPFGKLRVAQDFGSRLPLGKSRSFDSLRSLRISAEGSRSAAPRSRLLTASN